MISAFDIFKIGIGPSSSHTVGPMNAGKCFIDRLIDSGDLPRTTRITVDLYGSLSLTGKGHATDTAIIMAWRAIRRRMSILIAFRRLSRRLPAAAVYRWRVARMWWIFPSPTVFSFTLKPWRAMKTVCVLPPGTDKRRFYTKRITLLAAALLSKRSVLVSRTT